MSLITGDKHNNVKNYKILFARIGIDDYEEIIEYCKFSKMKNLSEFVRKAIFYILDNDKEFNQKKELQKCNNSTK